MIVAIAYKDFVWGIKRKYKKGQLHKIKSILLDVLESWKVHLQLPKVKGKSKQASMNRRSRWGGDMTSYTSWRFEKPEFHALDLVISYPTSTFIIFKYIVSSLELF